MILTFDSKTTNTVNSASKSFEKHFFAGAVLKIILYHRLKHIVDNSIWLDVYSMIVVFFSFFNSCVCCYGFVEAAPTSHHIQLIVKREQNEFHKPIVKQKQQTKKYIMSFFNPRRKKNCCCFQRMNLVYSLERFIRATNFLSKRWRDEFKGKKTHKYG